VPLNRPCSDCISSGQSRNRTLTDVVAAPLALRLTSGDPLAGPSFCWCRVRIGLRPNLTLFSLASARPRAVPFENAAAFELGRNTKDGKNDLDEVGCGIEERFAQ
jgi:hypothetical protein